MIDGETSASASGALPPRFSVIIPTMNRREMVLQAVESVQRQSFPAWEIIVVSDGSTDGAPQAIADAFPQVTIIQQQNLGLAVARNTGLAAATGDWICFLDDDDMWHPEKLALTRDYLAQHPDCKALIGPCWYFTAAPEGPTNRLAIPRDFVAATLQECVQQAATQGTLSEIQATRLHATCSSFDAILNRNQGLYISSCVVERRTLVRAGGAPPGCVTGEDWVMLLNVARLTTWHTLPHRLVFTRFHATQMTNTAPSDELESIAGFISVLYTGRPFPDRCNRQEFRNRLQSHGKHYRKIVQGFYWNAVRHRQFRHARRVRCLGRFLLPRWRDRLYSILPPQITWRWERYVLGMYK